MMKELYEFQKVATASVMAFFAQSVTAALLVAPPGSGKTVMGAYIASLPQFRRVLWVAHHQELVFQAAAELRRAVGTENVGVLMSGVDENPRARIQVASVETLIERGKPDMEFDLIVLDEAHHYEADTYRSIRKWWPTPPCLGLTATPQRYDGRPLGDTFEQMVVAANYSELLEIGLIVPPVIFRPPVDLGSDLVAQPVDSWLSFALGRRGFAFYPRVERAKQSLREWHRAGIRAEELDGETPKSVRKEAMESFVLGKLDLLTNVNLITEGVNVPEADAMLLARKFEWVGGFLQCTGRTMRSANGKEDWVLIDLCGSTHRHGSPVEDREYSLNGRPIIKKPSQGGEEEPKPRYFESDILDLPFEMLRPGEHIPVPARPIDGAELPKPIPTLLRGNKLRKIRMKHGARAARAASDYWSAQAMD